MHSKQISALHIYESVGFVWHGTIPKQIYYKNRYNESVKMSLEL